MIPKGSVSKALSYNKVAGYPFCYECIDSFEAKVLKAGTPIDKVTQM